MKFLREIFNQPYAYHGTSVKNAEIIKKQGIKPTDYTGKIWLSSDYSMARNYANRREDGKGIVFRTKLHNLPKDTYYNPLSSTYETKNSIHQKHLEFEDENGKWK